MGTKRIHKTIINRNASIMKNELVFGKDGFKINLAGLTLL